MEIIKVTVGICAYNEEANIRKALSSVYEQELAGFDIAQVIVVSSGSTDGTDEAVSVMMSDHPDLCLVRQDRREGKNSAINCLLDTKKTEIVAIMNADTIFFDKKCLQKLLDPLRSDKVGVVGGHPIPTNSQKTLSGFASHMIWTMHHHISMNGPKIGEIIAFRDIGVRLPTDMQSDEDIVKMKLEASGYESVYSPEARVYNKGPEQIKDYVKQRFRVNVGERYIKKAHDFDVPSWDIRTLYDALTKTMQDLGFHPLKMMCSIALETYVRIIASIYVKLDKGDMNIWDPANTTKKL